MSTDTDLPLPNLMEDSVKQAVIDTVNETTNANEDITHEPQSTDTNDTKEPEEAANGHKPSESADLPYPSRMTLIRGLINNDVFKQLHQLQNHVIKKIVIMVVVDAECKPLMEKYKFSVDQELTEKLLHLGIVSSGKVGDIDIHIIKVAESKVFRRHYSGYTQSAAIAALVSSTIKPDLVISFGTAGGLTALSRSKYNLGVTSTAAINNKDNNDDKSDKDVENEKNSTSPSTSSSSCVSVGDVVLGEACLFLDRLRTKDKNAFDWGLWGGNCNVSADALAKDLGLVKGVIGSQVSYQITKLQAELIANADVLACDMECAPIAQILNQTGINFIAVKVISNGLYPGDSEKMEDEYHVNRDMVSEKAAKTLHDMIEYFQGKKINEL